MRKQSRTGSLLLLFFTLLISIIFGISTASSYAAESGDINNDGEVNLKDALQALQISAGNQVSPVEISADVNGDNTIGIAETLYVLKAVSESAGQNEKWVAVYHPAYQWDAVPANSIPWANISHLIIGYLWPQELNGEYTVGIQNTGWSRGWDVFSQTANGYATAAHTADRKMICMLGGAGSNPNGEWDSATAADKVNTFAQNIKTVLQSLGCDGADLDWENSVDAPSLIRLARELRVIWPQTIITIPTGMDGTDAAGLADAKDAVDAFMPMTYIAVSGWWGGWTIPAPLTPLYGTGNNKHDVDHVLTKWTDAGVPASQIVMGVGGFGLVWGDGLDTYDNGIGPIAPYVNGGSGPAEDERAQIAGDNVVTQSWVNQALTDNPQMILEWDDVGKVNYWHAPAIDQPAPVTIRNVTREATLIFYETPRSITEKKLFIKNRNMKGMMFWTLSQLIAQGSSPVLEAAKSAGPEATLANLPARISNSTSTDIAVGGSDITHYKYNLDDSGYGPETSISSHIQLSALSTTSHTISVIGKNSSGEWQKTTNATEYTWEVDLSTPSLVISAPSESSNTGADVTYTITYSNAAEITLTSSHITLNSTGNATGSITVSGSGNSTRTITVTGISGTGTLGISLAAETAAAGNGNTTPSAGPSVTFTVDVTVSTASFSRYHAGSTHSPITTGVAIILRNIYNAGIAAGRQASGFAKIGDSISAGSDFMACFNYPDYALPHQSWWMRRRLEGYLNDLQPTANHFLAEAPGNSLMNQTQIDNYRITDYTSFFDRDSTAAIPGAGCSTILNAMQSELDTVNGTYSLVMCGANDTYGLISHSFAWVVDQYAQDIAAIIDLNISNNVIPLVRANATQTDGTHADEPKVLKTMSHMLRAVAQSRQIPYANMYPVFQNLPNNGLRDGVHYNAPDYSQQCWLDTPSLEYGAPNQNLIALTQLDRALEVTFNGTTSLDNEPAGYSGTGTLNDPVIVDEFPFVDSRIATQSFYYRLTLDNASDIRIVMAEPATNDYQVIVDGNEQNQMYEGSLTASPHVIEIRPVTAGEYWLVIQKTTE